MKKEKPITQAEKRKYNKAEFNQKYGRYWIIYTALIGTGILSIFSGLALPFQPDEKGVITFTAGRIFAAIFYAIGFASNGEFAAWFWFDKLTDHDKDNGAQKFIGVFMLTISVITILITSLAAGTFIAFFLGVLDAFEVLPYWAQKWVVWSIPVLWVVHFVFGVAFKTMSDEAASERDANSIIREAQQQILKEKAEARAQYWKDNAPELAARMGQAEAAQEIDNMYGREGSVAMASDVKKEKTNDKNPNSQSH